MEPPIFLNASAGPENAPLTLSHIPPKNDETESHPDFRPLSMFPAMDLNAPTGSENAPFIFSHTPPAHWPTPEKDSVMPFHASSAPLAMPSQSAFAMASMPLDAPSNLDVTLPNPLATPSVTVPDFFRSSVRALTISLSGPSMRSKRASFISSRVELRVFRSPPRLSFMIAAVSFAVPPEFSNAVS